MRNHYPITTHRIALPAMYLMPGRQRRDSLLVLQEEIQFPAHHGLAGTRRLKIVHIEQAAGLPDAMIPNSTRRGHMLNQSTQHWCGTGSVSDLMHKEEPISQAPDRLRSLYRTTAYTNNLAHPQREAAPSHTPLPALEQPELECWLEGRPVRLRRVGEVMADEEGTFYEVTGQQLCPLGELVSDDCGRIFEVQPASETQAVARVRSNGSSEGQGAPAGVTNSACRAETPPEPERAQVTQTADSPAYHKIVADPGLYLKLPWARVRNELAPQLIHPERLRDHDVIECYAQIYEAQRRLSSSKLAALELGDASLASQLYPLTQDRAHMLGAPQLFKPTREPFETQAAKTQAANREIYAGQRVYRLWPLFDPTVERAKPSEPIVRTEEAATTPRCQIPQQYLNPLQFKYSQEEVLYDMRDILGTLQVESGALVRWLFVYPLRLLKTLITVLRSRHGLKKWRTMLGGKSLDEQLWAVTPPHGFSYHPAVRSWSKETLVRAGYNPECMLLEWEIFWRQKGWR